MSLESLLSESATFRCTPRHEATTLTLEFVGEGDLDATSTIRRLLEEVHVEAQRLAATEVVVDLTRLEFLNSSGLKHFVSWLSSVGSLPDGTSYRIRLISSSTVPWQRRSISALRNFAPKLLTVDTVPAAS